MVIAGDGDGRNAGACARHSAEATTEILRRFPDESGPDVDEILDHVIAPIMYRILFAPDRGIDGFTDRLVGQLFEGR